MRIGPEVHKQKALNLHVYNGELKPLIPAIPSTLSLIPAIPSPLYVIPAIPSPLSPAHLNLYNPHTLSQRYSTFDFQEKYC